MVVHGVVVPVLVAGVTVNAWSMFANYIPLRDEVKHTLCDYRLKRFPTLSGEIVVVVIEVDVVDVDNIRAINIGGMFAN